MAEIEYIKHLYEEEEKKVSEICRTVRKNYRTVRKYIEKDNMSPVMKKSKEKYPVLGPFIGIIDGWLENDQRMPRKQRHTGIRVFKRLVNEHQFRGSDRTVRNYVSKKKKELKGLFKKAFVPLSHSKCEAQADFGEFLAIVDGKEQIMHNLTLTFPWSNAGFNVVMEAENAECLFEGLMLIFYHIGGVPELIVFDNLKPAVKKILEDGKRELTDSFIRFKLHFRFEARFCNKGSGNEKGNVENKVGYTRRNFFVPMPRINDIEEYNKELLIKDEEDRNRKHYKKEITIEELWEEEKKSLRTLPAAPYDNFNLIIARANKYGIVEVDHKYYSVSPAYAGAEIVIKLYYNRVEILNKDQERLTVHKRLYREKESIKWEDYIPLIAIKSGSLFNTGLYEGLPEIWKTYLKSLRKNELKSAVLMLEELILKGNEETACLALEMSQSYGRHDLESVRQLYYHLTNETIMPDGTIVPFRGSFLGQENIMDISVYDRLLNGGKE
jgi:transposase